MIVCKVLSPIARYIVSVSFQYRSYSFLSENIQRASCVCHHGHGPGCFLTRKHNPCNCDLTLKRTNASKAKGKDERSVLIQKIKNKRKPTKYVFEESVAKNLVKSILCHRANPEAPILEIEPGVGLVSREFLLQGVEQVVALEAWKIFHPYLQALEQEYGDKKFCYFNWNILDIFGKFNDPTYKSTEDEAVKRLSTSSFSDTETPYSIFLVGGSQENHNLIFYILRNLPFEDPILSKGRVEFFFMLHPKFKLMLEGIHPIDKPSGYLYYYSYFHTFISLLYDVTFIDEFNAKDFVPPFATSTRMKYKGLDLDKRHLVRMQLKADISKILPLEHHFAFNIFLRHLVRKRKARIVIVMEMLVAGSGLRMLTEGFTMLETVEAVSPQRYLQLYKSMVRWPEYSLSHLKNHILMMVQGGPMEDEDIQHRTPPLTFARSHSRARSK